MKCIKFNAENIMEELITIQSNEIEKMSKEEEIEYYDNILKISGKGFEENYNTTKIDNGQDEVIKKEKVSITFTTTQNQKNNINKNATTIDLGECENELRFHYNLSINETLYMKKVEVVQEGMKIPKIEYDVYSRLFGTNLIKLNLTVCKNSKILISIPIELDENLDIFNSSSGYYNDICYTTTSEYGTDITLNDRKKDFVDKNKMICQEDCEISKYNYETKKVECSCDIKESSLSIKDMNINKDKLFKNFKDIKNIANLNFLVCYKILLKKDGIINNTGFYLLLGFIFFHLIVIFVFYLNELTLIKKKIERIIYAINEDKIVSKNIKKKKDKPKYKSKKATIYKKEKRNKNHKNDIKYKKPSIDDSKMNSFEKINIKNNEVNTKMINLPYIDEEINELPYDLAIQLDKRMFCQYYISLIKTKHNLFFALCNNKNYNSKIIKIDLFFMEFAIDYIINALFFNDDTMHKIYQSKGEFDFDSQIPIIVYSTLISMILNSPLNFLSESSDAIINFKQDKYNINIMTRANNLKNKIISKSILYFIISFIFLLFFWYYISMFCVIYRNTQIHLLKDTLMSFGLSLLIPFVIYLFPGVFRIPSLSNAKKKRQYLYNFSKFLQSF